MGQLGLNVTGAGDELLVGVRAQISPRFTQRFGVRFVGVEFGPGDTAHHPRGVRVDSGREMRLVVVGMGHVRRDVGVIAEERLVEGLHGGRRVAHALHADRREVDVEVATETRHRFGMLGIEVGFLVRADADEAVLVSVDDAAVPSERPTERADRIGQHLAGVGAGVVREPLAGRPVGDPPVSHDDPSPSPRIRVRSMNHRFRAKPGS